MKDFLDKTDRQQRLLDELETSSDPVTGTELALRCGVTRQVVVHDIALLRAKGIQILSTPRGYLLSVPTEQPTKRTVLAVSHPPESTRIELMTLVDYGLRVLDVQVEHPLYGVLIGNLQIASRRDVELFLTQAEQQKAVLLSSLTEGDHYHTIEYVHENRIEEAIGALRKHGITVFDWE